MAPAHCLKAPGPVQPRFTHSPVNVEAPTPTLGPAGLQPAGQHLVDKLLQDLCLAACKADTPYEEPETEAVAWMLHVLGPLVQRPPRAAQIIRQLGKGVQGQVQQAISKDGKVFARKVCVLSAEQVAAGGTMVGMQDMVHAARCCLALIKPALLDCMPRYIALHMQHMPGIQQQQQQQGCPKSEDDEGRDDCVMVTLDMECLACNLTHYKCLVLHALSTEHKQHSSAALQGTPVGSRMLALAPLLTIMRKLLHGLRMLHRIGIIHCDIKPDNILLGLDEDGHTIHHVKLCDFGASCQMGADGTTNEARLATLTYQHHDKKCMRYEEQYAHHSSIQFDITELCASLLEVCLGLCPRTQLRAWLACSTVHERVLGVISAEQAMQRSWQCSAQGTFLAGLESLEQQGPAGQVCMGLLRVLVRGWYTAGQVGVDSLLSELQQVEQQHAALVLVEGYSSAVLLNGPLFPLPISAFDTFCASMTPLQAVRVVCQHPDAWQHYTAFLQRHCGTLAPYVLRPAVACSKDHHHGHAVDPLSGVARITQESAQPGTQKQGAESRTSACANRTPPSMSLSDSCQAASSDSATGELQAMCCGEAAECSPNAVETCSLAPTTPESVAPLPFTQGAWSASPTVATPTRAPTQGSQEQLPGLSQEPGFCAAHSSLTSQYPNHSPASHSSTDGVDDEGRSTQSSGSVTLSPAGTLFSQLSNATSLTLTPVNSMRSKTSAACLCPLTTYAP